MTFRPLILLLLLAGCATRPVGVTPLTDAQIDEDAANVVRLKQQVASNAAQMPPPPPKPSAVAQVVPSVVVVTPLALTVKWDGAASASNCVDIVRETQVLPPLWLSVATNATRAGPMSYATTASGQMGFFKIERAIQP